MIDDLRHAGRSLLAAPGFFVVVVVTLAVGIGLNTAIFSALYAVVLRPLPYVDPDRVMTLWEASPGRGIARERVSGGNFQDWREQAAAFDSMAAFRRGSHVLTDGELPVHVGSAAVSPAVFSLLGVPALHGRTFTAEEENEGSEQLAIISHNLWQQHYDADPEMVGAVIGLSDVMHRVVGIMPAGFHFPPGEKDVQVWTPLVVSPTMLRVRGMRFYDVVGRLGTAAAEEAAQAELAALTEQIAATYPESNQGWTVDVVPAHDVLVGPYASTLWLLWGAAGVVLVIACVNVASLTLARSGERQNEFAVRAALDAGKVALLRRSLAESLLLASVGGAGGLAVGYAGTGLLRRLMPGDIPRVDEIVVDTAVVGAALGAALLAGAIFGLVPALRAMSPRLGSVLQDEGRGHHGGGAWARIFDAMVVLEVALAIVLLVGAGLLIRSFASLSDVDPGFRIDDTVAIALTLPESKYDESGLRVQFFNGLVDAAAGIPGVVAAGAVSALPMSAVGLDFDLPFQILGQPPVAQSDRPRAEYRSVIPGYFEAMGIPLLRGRLLDRYDREQHRPVMVVNETMERLYFEGDAIGRSLGVPMAGDIEIVGVVGDVRHAGLGDAILPEMFVAYEQFSLRDMEIVLRVAGDRDAAVEAMRREVARLDPVQPITRVASLRELIDESLAQPRFNMFLLTALGGCALVLAAVGIYGIVSYGVARRTAEIGIRKAFGADDETARRMLLVQAMGRVGLGVAVGMAGAVAGSRWIRSLLFGIEPLDPATLAAVTIALLVVALAAAAIPAARAARIDPAIALQRR